MEHKGTRGAFKENASAFLKKQGFYVVLGLCFLCIAIAAAVALMPDREAQQAEPTPLSQAAGANQDEPLSEAVRPTPKSTPVATVQPTVTPAATPTSKPRRQAESKAAPPVEGEVIWGFAVDTLLYSETLEIWMTHDGVDIEARLGMDVIAIKSGTVDKVYDDKQLGMTVLVEHEGGLKSLYANLANPVAVKEGQRVNAGEKLGAVGDTAVSECVMEPHLHFALYQDDEAVDPLKHVLLGD